MSLYFKNLNQIFNYLFFKFDFHYNFNSSSFQFIVAFWMVKAINWPSLLYIYSLNHLPHFYYSIDQAKQLYFHTILLQKVPFLIKQVYGFLYLDNPRSSWFHISLLLLLFSTLNKTYYQTIHLSFTYLSQQSLA